MAFATAPQQLEKTTPYGIEEQAPKQWSRVVNLFGPLVEALDRLTAIRGLDENWDSYGAAVTDDRAYKQTRQLIASLNWKDVPAPNIVALPDGGVGLVFTTSAREVEVEVAADGTMQFLKAKKADPEARFDTGDFSIDDAQNVIGWVLSA